MKPYSHPRRIPYFAAHISTIVSVTLLLVLVGAISLLAIAATRTAREVRQNRQITLIMSDGVTDRAADSIASVIRKRQYALQVKVVTSGEALKEWNEATGEDVELIAGVNIFTPEIEIRLKEQFAGKDSTLSIASGLGQTPGVEEVVVPDTHLMSRIDSFISRAFLLLGIGTLAMIIISFVLINNTVLLSIYSRRFLIHTMQLVGATNGFIRRPFMTNNLLSGLISAAVASLILGGTLFFIMRTQIPDLGTYITPRDCFIVLVVIFYTGTFICGLSALIATNRYLRKNYDELFRA